MNNEEMTFKKRLNALKKEANQVINELYDLAKQVNFGAAAEALGNEVFTKSLIELETFAAEAKAKVDSIESKEENVCYFNKQALKLERAMSEFQMTFNWDNPLLEFVKEEE